MPAHKRSCLRANCILVILSEGRGFTPHPPQAVPLLPPEKALRREQAPALQWCRRSGKQQCGPRTGNGRIFGGIMHQKVRLCIKLRKLRKTGFCGALAIGNFAAKTGVKTAKIDSRACLFTTRTKVHPISTKNRIRASKTHKNAVFGSFSAIFPPIYAPKNTLFSPQQIIVIHCKYPQTPCVPKGLSLA